MVSWRVTDCTQPHPSHPHLIAHFTRIYIDKRCSNPVVLIMFLLLSNYWERNLISTDSIQSHAQDSEMKLSLQRVHENAYLYHESYSIELQIKTSSLQSKTNV